MYRIIDFTSALIEKAGTLFKGFDSGTFMAQGHDKRMEENINSAMNSVNDNSHLMFAPQIEVLVQSDGKLDISEANRIGREIGDTAMTVMNGSFSKRGKGSLRGVSLKT